MAWGVHASKVPCSLMLLTQEGARKPGYRYCFQGTILQLWLVNLFAVNFMACCSEYAVHMCICCAVLTRLHRLIVNLVARHCTASQLYIVLLKGNSLLSGKALLAN